MDDDDLPRHRFWRLPDDPDDQERIIAAVLKLDPEARVYRNSASLGSILQAHTIPAQVAAHMMGCTPNKFPSPK
ncbi:hypothetical protein K3172_15380 [Qipengyuania sp. 6B39]|uniref:hypothetical protein n=1 Tax=Qipengyuania proteolytica TaxID=2867239 RepID=UPI001C897272|nr:hypothetical protein [Qipengyuania proteolytica]MBX7497241.1 hypothetical protein [Qipengyuania proteolytica]